MIASSILACTLLVVYAAAVPVNQGVVTWGPWSACSEPCGYWGTQTRTKYCDTGSGPVSCEVITNRCGWSCQDEFRNSVWTECSKTCGGGTRSRTNEDETVTQTIDCNTQACESENNCPTDFTLVLDASGSIGELNFWKQKQFILDFLQTLVISSTETRIAAVTFASTSDYNFGLTTYDDVQLIIDHIWRIAYTRGSTNTAAGLKEMHDLVLTQRRSSVSQVSIVITDGASNTNTANTIPNALAVKADGIELVALGIANYNLVELKAIATSDDHVATVSNFDVLDTIISTITEITCTIAKTVDCSKCDFSQGLFWQPNLHNCHMYYVCVPLINGEYNPILRTCGSLYWNQAIRNCLPYPDTTSTCDMEATAPPTVATTTTPVGPCPYIANAEDPSLFSADGLSPFQSCGDGVFNSSQGFCHCEYTVNHCDDSMLLHFPFDNHLNDVTCMKALSQKVGAGTVTLVQDVVRGTVASFDGAYLDVPFLRSYFKGDHISEFSVCLHYKFTTVNGNTEVLVSNGDCLEVAGFEIGTSAQDASYKATYGHLKTSTGSTAQSSAAGTTPAVWHHVCWVFNGSNLQLYVDGVAQSAVSSTGFMLDTNVPMAIGARCGEDKFTGLIDEVQVYNYALTATQVGNM